MSDSFKKVANVNNTTLDLSLAGNRRTRNSREFLHVWYCQLRDGKRSQTLNPISDRAGVQQTSKLVRVEVRGTGRLDYKPLLGYEAFSESGPKINFLCLQGTMRLDNRPLHDGRGMMGNQGKNYSK